MENLILTDNINWTVKILNKGDKYGLKNCLTHNENKPVVEFYDRRYEFDHDIDGSLLGQFVSRYYVHTILDDEENYGLDLDSGIDDWSISAKGMEKVIDFLKDNQ